MNKDLEEFLKDPGAWVIDRLSSIEQRQRDATQYYERQKKILDDLHAEKQAELKEEADGVMKRARRWAVQHNIPWGKWEAPNDHQNNNL